MVMLFTNDGYLVCADTAAEVEEELRRLREENRLKKLTERLVFGHSD